MLMRYCHIVVNIKMSISTSLDNLQSFLEWYEDMLVAVENCFSIDVPEVDSDLTCFEAAQAAQEGLDKVYCDFVAFNFNEGVYPEGCTAPLPKLF